MINEKELRTGNLYSTIRNQEIIVRGIDTLNKFVVVDPIDSNPEASGKLTNSIIFEDLNPIEINSLKSERLGFTSDKLMTLAIESDNGAKFMWDEKASTVIFKDGQDGTVGQTIRYIHQFQNLYFFLTGKELVL